MFSDSNLLELSIKDLGEVVTGTTPSKENKLYWDNGSVVWITPSDLNYYKDISTSMCLLTEEGLKRGRYIPANSVLVTCIASIGKNALITVNGSCNQQINAIIPKKEYDSNYIYYLMEYIAQYLKSIAGTSATAIINKDSFEKIKVRVHSSESQKYIGKYLTTLEDKILLEDTKLAKLQELKKGLMQNMFV